MADITIQTTRFAVTTATAGSTQDVTIPGFGSTPKAAMFIMSDANANDTISADGAYSIGFYDGNLNGSTAHYNRSLTGNTDATRASSIGNVVLYPNASGNAVLGGLGAQSFIPDGVRLVVNTAFPTTKLVTAIFFGGDDLTGAIHGRSDLLTATGNLDVTSVGFEPSLVFMSCVGSAVLTDESVHSILSWGVGVNDGFDTQRMLAVGGENNTSTSSNTALASNTTIASQTFNGTASWQCAINNYNPSGFSLNRLSNSGGDYVFYLALQLSGDAEFALTDVVWPTSGNYSDGSIGFQPNFGIITSLVGATAYGSVTTTNNFSISDVVFDESNIFSSNSTSEDGVSTQISSSLSDDRLHILDEDGVTSSVVGSSYSLDANGWTFNLSTNPAAPVIGWGLAIKTQAPVVSGPTIDTQPQPQTVTEPDAATFTVVATTSGGALSYQWKDDGVNVGTNSATYNTGPTSVSMDGSLITVDVTDDNGTTVSDSALLTVNAAVTTPGVFAGDAEITNVYAGDVQITAVYADDVLIWEP